MTTDEVRDLIIVGSGPAGYTAAIYAARAQLHAAGVRGHPVRRRPDDHHRGGELPRLPDGIMGPELMEQMREQAERFGAELRTEDVEEVVARPAPIKTVDGERRHHRARAVVLAMGAAARYLNVPGEQQLLGRGVTACATCDGFFFRDQDIVVVGGGDSAMEEATFLTRFARLGDDRAPPRRVPRLQDHAGAGPQGPEDPLARPTPRSPRCSATAASPGCGCATPGPARSRRWTSPACSWRSATTRAASCSATRSTPTTTATCTVGRARHRHRASPACSPAATSSTTPTGRPSPPPAPAAPRRSTPSAGSPRAPCRAELAGGGYGTAVRRRSPPSAS